MELSRREVQGESRTAEVRYGRRVHERRGGTPVSRLRRQKFALRRDASGGRRENARFAPADEVEDSDSK